MGVIATAMITIRDSSDYHIGSTAPVSPYLDMMWLDTSGAITTAFIGPNTGVTDVEVVKEIFETQISQNGRYTFIYSENDESWVLEDEGLVDLVDYGITITGEPDDGDRVIVKYLLVTDVWKRWNGTEWVETVLSQEDIDNIHESVVDQSTSIEQLSNAIQTRVTLTQYDSDMANMVDKTYVDSQIESVVTQTATDIEQRFTTTEGRIDDLTGEFSSYRSTTESYQRFSAEGMELGKTDSPFKAKLSNEKLAFQQDNVDVAYISNKRMYVSEAEISKMVTGNEDNGFFDWTTSNLGLGIRWRG